MLLMAGHTIMLKNKLQIIKSWKDWWEYACRYDTINSINLQYADLCRKNIIYHF